MMIQDVDDGGGRYVDLFCDRSYCLAGGARFDNVIVPGGLSFAHGSPGRSTSEAAAVVL